MYVKIVLNAEDKKYYKNAARLTDKQLKDVIADIEDTIEQRVDFDLEEIVRSRSFHL